MSNSKALTVFAGDEILARGTPRDVTRIVATALAAGDSRAILAFDDETGRQVDLDLRILASDPQDVRTGEENAPEATRRAGRPRLGVVAREVTLLPRHWDWLGEQPGGASVTLRKLVDAARKAEGGDGEVRRAREAADRFMSAMLGNQPRYEDAARALYAGDRARFLAQTEGWPPAPRAFLLRLAEPAFPVPAEGPA